MLALRNRLFEILLQSVAEPANHAVTVKLVVGLFQLEKRGRPQYIYQSLTSLLPNFMQSIVWDFTSHSVNISPKTCCIYGFYAYFCFSPFT